MKIEEYISFRYQGEQPEGAFQYETRHGREHYLAEPEALRAELWRFYYDGFFGQEKPSMQRRFLDFHYHAYKGDKVNFTHFVKQSARRIPDEVLDTNIRIYIQGELNDSVNGWLGSLPDESVELQQGRDFEEAPEAVPPSSVDTRITGRMAKDKVQAYFMEVFFHTKDSNGVPYFGEREVMHFLHANFRDFNPRGEVKKLSSGAVKAQIHIRRSVYRFYCEHTIGNSREKRRYCELLRDNFHEFDNSDFEQSIVKNFSK